jgi:lipopolysaccharide/colanic/teichoic acid biosynthesis glycosyltransferase
VNPKELGVSAQAMQQELDRSPDVERAAERLARPHARAALAAKRTFDVVLALLMLVALLPLFGVVALLLVLAGDGWTEHRVRLGRDGRPVVLTRFRALPGGAVGRALERIGVRELPVLVAIVRGRVSFVGPRALPPGTDAGHTGPRRLMAPGLLGPAQRRCNDAVTESQLDDAYVEQWSLWTDVRLLAGGCPPLDQSVSKVTS